MPETIWSKSGKYSSESNDFRCYCKIPLILQNMECGNCGGIITNSNRDNNGNPLK